MARAAQRRSSRAFTLLCVAGLLACGRDQPSGRSGPSATPSATASTAPPARSARLIPTTTTSSSPAHAASAVVAIAPTGDEVYLGEALPVALTRIGAVAVLLPDQLVVAPFRAGQLDPFPAGVTGKATPVAAVDGDDLVRVYWISEGLLLRRAVRRDGTVGDLDRLAEDAASGYPLDALSLPGAPGRDVVVYVDRQAGEQGERNARLWIESQGSTLLRDSSVTSAALVATGARAFEVLSLDGRAGMSSVHAISAAVGSDRVELGEDRVVYVLGETQWHTQLEALAAQERAVALLPVAKDISHFGLLSLRVPRGKAEAKPSWVDYPNGLNPAPIAVANLCGQPHVAFVRPESSQPNSPRLIQLGILQADGRVGGVQMLASAIQVTHLALGPVPKLAGPKQADGWLAYATEAGLWAKAIRCNEE